MKRGERVIITRGAYKGRLGTTTFISSNAYVIVNLDEVADEKALWCDGGELTFLAIDVEDAVLYELARL